jgi:hypothetical protein
MLIVRNIFKFHETLPVVRLEGIEVQEPDMLEVVRHKLSLPD